MKFEIFPSTDRTKHNKATYYSIIKCYYISKLNLSFLKQYILEITLFSTESFVVVVCCCCCLLLFVVVVVLLLLFLFCFFGGEFKFNLLSKTTLKYLYPSAISTAFPLIKDGMLLRSLPSLL